MSLLRNANVCGCFSSRGDAPRASLQPSRTRATARGLVIPKASAAATHHTSTAFKNQLEALNSMTVVVADTGELELVKKYRTTDCTTNPSLVYRALAMPENRHYLEKALASDKRAPEHSNSGVSRPFSGVADQLSVDLGCELLKVVPGRVSTEVDANLSYSTQATVDKALRLMDMYAAHGIDSSRIYIKMASTWEGIEACRRLEKQGINCNMTLLFSFAQAAACADAGATLISPFVARIMEWYKAKEGRDRAPHEHPGVLSVRRMYNYYRAHGYKTLVMPASFRSIREAQDLAGVDKITVPPWLLDELEKTTGPLERVLSPETASIDVAKITNITEESFKQLDNATETQMMEENLEKGIAQFTGDQKKLEDLLASIATVKV